VLGLCCALPSVAASQDQTAIGVTVGLSSQNPGDSDRPYLGPGFGGSAVGAIAFADRVTSRRTDVGGEASVSGDIEARQQQRTSTGANDFRTRHRDAVFSAILKYRLVGIERAYVNGAVGGGVAWRHTVRDGTGRANSPPFDVSTVHQTLSNGVFAATLGLDGVVMIGLRTGFVFSGRVHLLADRDREPDGVVRRGVASTLVRVGGGARFAF